MPRQSAISLANCGWALPEKTFRSPNPVDRSPSPLRGLLIAQFTSGCARARRLPVNPRRRAGDETRRTSVAELVGAGGFEPPNTGSKVPRLTAWPRPTTSPRRPGTEGSAVRSVQIYWSRSAAVVQTLSVDETCGSGQGSWGENDIPSLLYDAWNRGRLRRR